MRVEPDLTKGRRERLPGRFLGPTLLAAVVLGLGPGSAAAQFHLGGHLVTAQDAFDGTLGMGVRAGIDPPVLPFELMASGEYFFADCPPGESGCGLYGLTVDANFRLVFPVVTPYIQAGLAYRNIDPAAPNEDESVTGPALGAGVDVGLSGIRIFGEGRYEFVDAPEKQFVWRLGALFQVY